MLAFLSGCILSQWTPAIWRSRGSRIQRDWSATGHSLSDPSSCSHSQRRWWQKYSSVYQNTWRCTNQTCRQFEVSTRFHEKRVYFKVYSATVLSLCSSFYRMTQQAQDIKLDVEWEKPKQTYGELKGYKLRYGIKDQQLIDVILKQTVHHYPLTNLGKWFECIWKLIVSIHRWWMTERLQILKENGILFSFVFQHFLCFLAQT